MGIVPAGRPSIRMSPQMTEQLDRQQMRDLVDRYAVAVDERDAHGFTSVFTPDGTLAVYDPDDHLGRTVQGHADLAAIPVSLGRYRLTFHMVSTHVVAIEGDHATGTALCEAHHLSGPPPRPPTTDRVRFIRYDDRYVRHGAGWLIHAREVHTLWMEERTLP